MDWAKVKARKQGEASFRASREADAWAREQGAPPRKAQASKADLRAMLEQAMAATPGARVRVITPSAPQAQPSRPEPRPAPQRPRQRPAGPAPWEE
jgi:hypothetical protein